MNTQEVRVTRGNRRRRAVIDLNVVPGDQEGTPTVPAVASPSVPTIIDVDAIEDDVIELSASAFAEAKNKSRNARRTKSKRLTRSKAPAPPPEEPKFTCPICMCPFTKEMSTKCGHIFCKGCIKMAISRQGKCPTCRKKVTAKELIRVFLPATR